MACRTDKATLIKQIAQCEFILLDINLFLDTHPDHQRAISDYNCYAEQLAVLKDMYVRNYGPLENFGNSVNIDEKHWLWASQPFPWQKTWMEG